jgi:hypothetical protein
MKLVTAIILGVLLSLAVSVSPATAQPTPCETCQSCDSPPCGCAGHSAGCCCDGLCKQAPPNPLAPGRPSPPPCCADGYCYPNCETWGHYRTRWRRWPIEIAATTPTGAATPRPLGPDVPAYDVLPPEEEDRRAPPPSATRGKPVEVAPREAPPQEDNEKAPATGPTAPQNGTGTDLSPESIFGLPPESTPAGAPIEDTPGTTPLGPLPGGDSSPATTPPSEPTGELDLPPALPFASPKLSSQPAVRSSGRPTTPAPRNRVRTVPQDDPPPALPTALASVLR